MTTDVDAVVVGSGPNGLVAAVTLAEAGWKVLVLEAQNQAGGGMRTEELTLPGFRHDVCSAVHPMALASPAFRELELAREGLAFAQPRIPLGHPIAPGDTAYLRRDVVETAAGLGADGPLWKAVMGTFGSRWPQLARAIGNPLRPTPDLIALGATSVWPTTWLMRGLRDEHTRALLAGIAAHSINDLHQPATALIGVALGAFAHGVGWPVAIGGSQSIADALIARLRSLGGDVVTGHRVRNVDNLPSARAVLLSTTPRQALQLAGHRFAPRYAKTLSRFRYGPGVFKVDWALDAPVPWSDPELAGAGTVHIGGRGADVVRAEREVAQGRVPDEPFVLLSQPTDADPSRAPEGKHTLWAYCHVPHGSEVDMTDAIEQQIERFAPGFRDRIIGRHTMDPAAMEAHNANDIGGSIDGGLADLRQLLARPTASLTPWATSDERIFLASASTMPGPGVNGMAGRLAAQTVLKRLG
ncbi:phytoene desaturase family protein [Microbacterium amylolyticum]|uniref:Phytoene dehydrogenase-like protein n=1 Tax=Microbacterium amylolyticum TaxID=936337 RepID=A0ABS4ZG22_9MICO|nr:NAD(P)/FAD-dependent oxidoreductase [Microbacterium amylolyticum]MBP2436225.1 phytoene dehydrogenase-like protein [Microbacterium amylolyticum]